MINKPFFHYASPLYVAHPLSAFIFMESANNHILLLNTAPVLIYFFFISKPNNMNKNLIMKTDILDIIFEHRNKAYGAYDLRKFYYHRLKTALGSIMLIAVSLAAFTFLPKRSTVVSTRVFDIPETELPKLNEKPKEQFKNENIVKKETGATQANQKKLLSTLVIVPNTDKADTIKTINETDVIGSVNTVVTDPGPVFIQPVNTETGNAVASIPKIDKPMPLEMANVDVPPTYPGGMDALRKFLERNLHNPKEMEEGESVSVRVKFVVDYNGKLQSFVNVLDGGEAFNKEVVRVLKKMPEWIPGKANGENVSVYYTIPVKFVMSN